MRTLSRTLAALVIIALSGVPALAQEPGDAGDASVSPVVIADTADDGGVDASTVAFGVVSGAALAGGIAFLLAAKSTGEDLAAVDGTLIIDTNNRLVLRQEQESQRIIGYTLIGIGVVAGTAMTWKLVGADEDDGGASVSVAPMIGGAQGVRLNAQF